MGHFGDGRARRRRRILRHLVRLHRLYARRGGPAEPHQQVCHAGVLLRRQGAGHLEPQQGEPHRHPLQEHVALPRAGTRRHRGRAVLRPFRYRLPCLGARHRQEGTPGTGERRRRFHHHAAVGEAVVQRDSRQHPPAFLPETDRVGDRHQTGTLLHQAGNHRPLPQLLRLPAQCRGHQDGSQHLLQQRTQGPDGDGGGDARGPLQEPLALQPREIPRPRPGAPQRSAPADGEGGIPGCL